MRFYNVTTATPTSLFIASETEMTAFATQLASVFKQGDVVFLRGTLGAGKSTLARALIRSLMNEPCLDVPSPTFTLVQSYDSQTGPVYHYDLYRLESSEEIFEIGIEDSLAHGISLIEWPERLEGIQLPNPLDLDLHIEKDTTRRIIIHGDIAWNKRLESVLSEFCSDSSSTFAGGN